MLPSLSPSNEIYGVQVNIVSIGDDLRLFFGRSNSQNIIVRKLSMSMSHASRMTILFCAISTILTACSSKQMIRIYAWRIVASVKNITAIRNWTFEQAKRATMRKVFLWLLRPAFLQNSIFEFTEEAGSLPFPTWCIKSPWDFFNSRPKSFFCDFLPWRCHVDNIWYFSDMVK